MNELVKPTALPQSHFDVGHRFSTLSAEVDIPKGLAADTMTLLMPIAKELTRDAAET